MSFKRLFGVHITNMSWIKIKIKRIMSDVRKINDEINKIKHTGG